MLKKTGGIKNRNNMEKKHLIGKKVRGFKFEDNGGCYYHGGIKLYEGYGGIRY